MKASLYTVIDIVPNFSLVLEFGIFYFRGMRRGGEFSFEVMGLISLVYGIGLINGFKMGFVLGIMGRVVGIIANVLACNSDEFRFMVNVLV